VPRQSGAPQSLTTGPDKATFDRTDIQTRVETLKNSFIQSVQNERGDRITLERTELANANTYGGATAVENGMADEIGGLETALAAAADLAEIGDYTVEYRSTSAEIPLLLGGGANSTTTVTAATPGVAPPGVERPQYLMMWGTVETAADYQEVNSDGSQ
jgi:Periplasmic serine proteases (ClpP class)